MKSIVLIGEDMLAKIYLDNLYDDAKSDGVDCKLNVTTKTYSDHEKRVIYIDREEHLGGLEINEVEALPGARAYLVEAAKLRINQLNQ